MYFLFSLIGTLLQLTQGDLKGILFSFYFEGQQDTSSMAYH